jgi:hypothetical protein
MQGHINTRVFTLNLSTLDGLSFKCNGDAASC